MRLGAHRCGASDARSLAGVGGTLMAKRRRRRREGTLLTLSELVRTTHPAPDQVDQARMFAWWTRSLPARIVQHARPKFLRGGVLTVVVDSHVWAQELQLETASLMSRIRAGAPDVRVHRLRFVVGKLPHLGVMPREPKPLRPIPVQELPDEAGRALAAIADDELRDVVARSMGSCLARQSRNQNEAREDARRSRVSKSKR